MQRWLAALAVIYLAAHLAFLPPTLEDLDSINFALGVRHFDVAQHQPHPPGYPVFIALGKASTAAFNGLGIAAPAPRGLAFWSAVAGASMLPLLFALYRSIGDERTAFWGAALVACSPLVWSTSMRPLSDATGLALAVAAQALILKTLTRPSGDATFLAGALLAGVAAGVRIQTAALTAPILLVALAMPAALGRRAAIVVPSVRTRSAAVLAVLVGVAAWAVPMLAASGGLTHYLTALGTQAGEDFEGVVMVWTMRTPRVALEAVLNTVVRPWGHPALATVVLVGAVVGLIRAVVARELRAIGLLSVLFGPYAVFHLLFHETATIRYAMPLVVPVGYFFVRGVRIIGRFPVVELATAAIFLAIGVPAMTAFARSGSPAFAAMRDALESGRPVSGHATMRRVWDWFEPDAPGRFLVAPHGYEWLTMVAEWSRSPDVPIEFLANPARTDLLLFDPHAASFTRDYRWAFPEVPFVAGARPGEVRRVVFNPPGWMLDRGWAVSAEVAGITEKEGYGPHRKPSIAWVRGRGDATTLVIGGRHLGAPGDPEVEIPIDLNGVTVATIKSQPGFFAQTIDFPEGAFRGIGYLPLTFTARSLGPLPVRVALEQFDLQGPGTPMMALLEGWQEPEYDRTMGRAWRWASDRVVLWVRPVGREVTVTLRGESPLKYFDAAPTLRATIGNREIASLLPAADFTWDIRIPAADLPPDGRVVIQSDKWFVPGEREGTADKRRLALRIYSYGIR